MRVLLLAGGGGTRMWPISTEERPKQFLPLLSGKSLLAETYARVKPIAKEVFVATTVDLAPRVRKELRGLPASHILAEPCRRNSGPAILSAAMQFEQEGDDLTAAVPSDQTVADDEAFRKALLGAGRAADAASVVVLGVLPARPETDYGYLEVREGAGGEGLDVVRFIEKPESARAEDYVRSGHFWNAGIFVFRPSRLLGEARRTAPELMAGVAAYRRLLGEGDEAGSEKAYAALPSISIDYAVMEKASHVRAVPLRAGWSDVGTWRAVRDLKGVSEDGNLIVSDVPVLAPGVRNSAIVVGPEGVLVLPFEKEGELRVAVDRLRRDQADKRARKGEKED